MADPATGDGAAQHGGDVILHQQVAEALGTVTAGEGDHGGERKCLRLPEAIPDIA